MTNSNNQLTFPDGTVALVDYNGMTSLRTVPRGYARFFIDTGFGIELTDDTDELHQAEELGFQFPDWYFG